MIRMDLEFQKSAHNFLQKLGEIIEKYDQDFTLVSDIVDLNTGLLDVDNGHLRKLCVDSSLLQNGYFPEAEEVEEGEEWAETYTFDLQHHPLPLGQQLGHYPCQLQCQKRENKYEFSNIIGRIAATPHELEEGEEEDIWENSLYSLQKIYAKKLKKQKLASSPIIIAAKDTTISPTKVNTLKKQQVELLNEPNVVVLLSDDEDSLMPPLPSSTMRSSTMSSSTMRSSTIHSSTTHSSINRSLVATTPIKAPSNSIGTVSQQPQQLPRKDQDGQDEWDPPVESFILA